VNLSGALSTFTTGGFVFSGVAIDSSGTFYTTDGISAVYKVGSNGAVTRIAGSSQFGFSGDGEKAINALLHDTRGIAVDLAGKIYVADVFNNRVRVITPDG